MSDNYFMSDAQGMLTDEEFTAIGCEPWERLENVRVLRRLLDHWRRTRPRPIADHAFQPCALDAEGHHHCTFRYPANEVRTDLQCDRSREEHER